MEESIGYMVGGNSAKEKLAQEADKEPTPKDMIVFASNDVKAPNIQPIVNPADFTLMLYQRGLMEQFTEVINQPNKDKMIESLQNNVYSMGGLVRTITVLLDDTMRPHVAATIDKVLDGYQDKPFYKDLVQIKSFASEQLIQKSLIDQEAAKSFHKDLVSTLLSGIHAEKGFDNEVISQMSASAISKRSIDDKRLFYKEFVNSLRSLDENSKWVSIASKTLKETYEMAAKKVNTPQPHQPSQMQPEVKKNSGLSYD